MRTSEVADAAGVDTATLRYYERRGVLEEPPRTASGYRDYPDSTVATLRFIKRAQRLGFTLAQVEELVELSGGGPESCDGARDLAQRHADVLDNKIADLQRMRSSLQVLISACHLPRAERPCPLLAALSGTPGAKGEESCE